MIAKIYTRATSQPLFLHDVYSVRVKYKSVARTLTHSLYNTFGHVLYVILLYVLVILLNEFVVI